MDVIESNKLIADFMDVKIGVDLYSYRPGCSDFLKEENIQYDSSWGWLMPVLHKIYGLGYWYAIYPSGTEIGIRNEDGCVVCVDGDQYPVGSITYTYKAVIEFIEWYNGKQTPKTT